MALAARNLSIPATILVPRTAPLVKRRRTQDLGAVVKPIARYNQEREEIAAQVAIEENALLVGPYDDPLVIAGQGTVGLEIAEEISQLTVRLDLALICVSGGGLIAGCSIKLRHHFPDVEIYSVEPEGFDDTSRSLKAGIRVANEPGAHSICDALLSSTPGEITFEINKKPLVGGLTVSDTEVRHALPWAFQNLKLLIELGVAVALAAALSEKVGIAGKTVIVLASGSNVDPDLFSKVLSARSAEQPTGEIFELWGVAG